jgi:hypothetical protein
MRENDRASRNKEAHRVEREGGRRAGGCNEKAAHDRSGNPGALSRESLDRVASDEDFLGDELGDDRAESRDAEGARSSEECVRNVEVPDL